MWDDHKSSCSVFLSKELADTTKTHGQESQEVVESMMDLANVFILQCRYPEAEKILREAEPIAQKVFEQKDPHVAVILHNIGGVLLDEDRIKEAVDCFQTSLDMLLARYGSESVEVASNLVCMGNILVLRGDYVWAQEPFQEALRLYQTEQHKFPGDVDRLARIANCLSCLGGVDMKMGNVESAVEKYTGALAIREDLPNGCPEEQGCKLMYMVDLHVAQSKLVEALVDIEKALPILRSVH